MEDKEPASELDRQALPEMSVPKIGRDALHRKYDRHQGRIKHARDRTNSLCDSTTAPETVGIVSVCICC
ncbi:MAG: hypothetical protein WBA89_25545 [Microcoleus sp.]|uniref:hypothetical protein n=1 Tax=Microcoleus sp. TaxID=44472 RepID=UPI003C775380